MIESLVLQGSTYAAMIDRVINVVGIMVGFWGALTAGMFFWLLWRWRYQEGVRALYITGTEPELKRWIVWPHNLIILCDLVLIYFAVTTWYHVKQFHPETTESVRAVAQQWSWTFEHTGPDGVFDTEDDIKTADELHVVVNKPHSFRLESRDVLHSFSIPIFRLKQDVIPGRQITGWFEPTVTGTYDLQCTEMCGIGHGIMNARIVIETEEEHARWMASVPKYVTAN
jgi:cytochrome c oxidase subunit II